MDPEAHALDQLIAEIESFQVGEVQPFNRNIFIYWNTGLQGAPDIVRLALLIAQTLNREYQVFFLDEANLAQFFPYKDAIFAKATIDLQQALFSDVLRSYLVCKFGGIWLDASCLALHRFANWLEPILAERDFFLWKSKSFTDRLIMSWFVAGKPNAKMLAGILQLLVPFIVTPRPRKLQLTFHPENHCPAAMIGPTETDMRAIRAIEEAGYYPYFTYHYLWNEVAKRDLQLAASLRALPDIPLMVAKFDRRKFGDAKFFEWRDGAAILSPPGLNADKNFSEQIKARILKILGPAAQSNDARASAVAEAKTGSHLAAKT